MPAEQVSTSVADTERIAGAFAVTLPPGSTVALYGNLGAGKTQFVRGIVRALGGNPRAVSSPTFTLLNIYDTPKFPVFHLDAYRTTTPEDFESIGFLELLEQGGVVVVEWPSRIAALLPGTTRHVTLETLDESTRLIKLPD
jgi:tRNA threonylcarbamoyladenosine biosynthesis protein TsaE